MLDGQAAPLKDYGFIFQYNVFKYLVNLVLLLIIMFNTYPPRQ